MKGTRILFSVFIFSFLSLSLTTPLSPLKKEKLEERMHHIQNLLQKEKREEKERVFQERERGVKKSERASEEYVREHLGTKKNYSPEEESGDYTPPPDGCRMVHLQYVARHGTREPTSGDIEKLSELQDRIAQFISDGGQFKEEYSWMATWQNPYISGQAGLLSVIGEDEHYNTSKRMLNNYGSILNRTYNPNRFDFQETAISRTGVSASSFAYGMTEARGNVGPHEFSPVYIWSRPKYEDTVLRFFESCPYYSDAVLNNDTAFEQALLFRETLNVNALELSIRLGTYPLWVIGADELLNMWIGCRAEASLSDDYSHFCSIWNEQDVDDIAYREDLEFYWKRGYGHPINYLIAVDLMTNITADISKFLSKLQNFSGECHDWLRQSLATDIVRERRKRRDELLQEEGIREEEETLSEREEIARELKQSIERGESCPDMAKNIPYQMVSTLRFAHAETVIPLTAWLNFFFTEPNDMKWDTPPSVRSQRKWRTTAVSPYSANYNFVVYVCGEEGERRGREERGREERKPRGAQALIKVLHNEEEMVVDGCGGSVYCPYQDFLSIFQQKLSLDYNTICGI